MTCSHQYSGLEYVLLASSFWDINIHISPGTKTADFWKWVIFFKYGSFGMFHCVCVMLHQNRGIMWQCLSADVIGWSVDTLTAPTQKGENLFSERQLRTSCLEKAWEQSVVGELGRLLFNQAETLIWNRTARDLLLCISPLSLTSRWGAAVGLALFSSINKHLGREETGLRILHNSVST